MCLQKSPGWAPLCSLGTVGSWGLSGLPPKPLASLCWGTKKKKSLKKWAEVLLAALHASHQKGVCLIEPPGTIPAHFRQTGGLAAGISKEQVNRLALPLG